MPNKFYKKAVLVIGLIVALALAYLVGVEAAGQGVRKMESGVHAMINAEPDAHDTLGDWGHGYDNVVWGYGQARCPIWWQVTHYGLVPSSVSYPAFKILGCAGE